MEQLYSDELHGYLTRSMWSNTNRTGPTANALGEEIAASTGEPRWKAISHVNALRQGFLGGSRFTAVERTSYVAAKRDLAHLLQLLGTPPTHSVIDDIRKHYASIDLHFQYPPIAATVEQTPEDAFFTFPA
jgi:hypothetical protein